MGQAIGLAAALVLAVLCAGSVGTAQTVPASKSDITLSFAPVVRAAAPSVVNIYARRIVAGRVSPFAGDPFFDQMFRNFGATRPEVQNSLGSGVIVGEDGLVVSNYHVVGMADEITVVMNDQREYRAELLLSDQDSDLAILRLQGAEALPALPFRDSDEVEVGELVLAIGNPFGIGQTVSMGIVSATARSALAVGNGRGYFLQTDAAINPGNSGGALVDGQGRLVGINTAILTQSGGSNGIGFAIPANLVRAVLDQARAGVQRFQRPWAGVGGQAVDAAMAEGLGLARPGGVILSDLHPASPFLAAGLQSGDVVVRLDDAPVNTPQEMMFRLSAQGIGGSVAVDYLRDGKPRQAEVALIAPPDSPPRDQRTIAGDVVLRGLVVAQINPAVMAELDLGFASEGVVVVAAEDLAARAGLQRGDVVLGINGTRIDTPADVERAAKDRVRLWEVDLIRDGSRVRMRFRV